MLSYGYKLIKILLLLIDGAELRLAFLNNESIFVKRGILYSWNMGNTPLDGAVAFSYIFLVVNFLFFSKDATGNT